MAAYHTRSNSLPSRDHPLIPEFDEQLCRLRSSEAASSSTLLSGKLNRLQDLHDCVDKLLLLPLNQQALSKKQNEKWIDELLDRSLRILDMCNTAKETLLQTNESTKELQSIMRRKRGDESSLSCEVKKFLMSWRKMVKKAVRKAMENKCSFSLLNKGQEIVSMLGEAQSITLLVFESVFSFISGPKSSSWSLVSRLMNSKKVSCEEGIKSNEFTSADAALNLLISQKMKKSDSTLEENSQTELQKLEMCIQDLEEGVENLYRRLIKTRVSLLNILNHLLRRK